MFGYSRPQRLDMTFRDHNHHRAHYCGMCGALKRLYGRSWRLATNFDTALIALLISAQRSKPPEFRRRYCPFGHAWGFGVVVDDDVSVKIAASLTAVMIGLKIDDARRDGTPGAGVAGRLVARAVAKAREELEGYDETLIRELHEFDVQLVNCEKQGVSYDQLLQPTALGLGRVLQFTSEFADSPEVAARNNEHLNRLGRATGRLIYTLDCFEDLEKDVKKSQFNGLLASGLITENAKYSSLKARDDLEYLVKRCKTEIEVAMGQLHLFRYASIISNILFLGLIPKVERALMAVGLEDLEEST